MDMTPGATAAAGRAGRGDPPLRLIWSDEAVAAFHKPAGLLVHRSAIDRHETRFALQEAREVLGRHVYPVHRLDKPTSGVLLFALTPGVARSLTGAFAGGRVAKTYLAVVRGHMAPVGVMDRPLAELQDPMTDSLADPAKASQRAVTAYRRRAVAELPFAVGRYATARYSLVELRPHTGRRHQIRRHLKHAGHPVVGDTTHGDGRHNAFFRRRFQCRRLLLAATGVELAHPVTQVPLCIACPPAEDFQQVVDAIPWCDQVSQPPSGVMTKP